MAKKEKFDYFEAFGKLSKLTIEEADLLIECIENYTSANDLDGVLKRAHKIEHAGDELNHAIFRRVATDFITPIEREDIIELTSHLDDIIDYIEDVMQRFYMYDVQEVHKDALAFAKLIRKGCVSLDKAMGDFRNFKKSKSFKQHIVDVNTCEEEADTLGISVTHALYVDCKDDPMYVLAWSQIFNRLEKCSDACEHVADSMNSILMKNA